MNKTDREKIISYYTISKKIILGTAAAVLVSLFIKYSPDYDHSVLSADTIGFIGLMISVLYVLNQLAELVDEKRRYNYMKSLTKNKPDDDNSNL